MPPVIRRVALAAVALGIGAACSLAQQVSAAPVQLVDGQGDRVALPAPAQRVVALAPHLAENLFAAGAGARLVGTTAYSDYPAGARAIARVGGYNSLSLEKIIALRPDLVIAWGAGTDPTLVSRLRHLGIPVYVDATRQLRDIAASIEALGRLTGFHQTAAARSETLRARLHALAAAERSPRLDVFYQVWHEPLQTVGGNHLISEVIRLCGGSNIFAELQLLAPRVNPEAVIARQPQVIVGSGRGEALPEELTAWRRYGQLPAVRNDALCAVDPDVLQRPTPRILAGARDLCACLDEARDRAALPGD